MHFRPRLLKQHFHFFAAYSLSIMLPQTVCGWAVMNGFIFNVSLEKEIKREESTLKSRRETQEFQGREGSA
jgi:hypothetical protein